MTSTASRADGSPAELGHGKEGFGQINAGPIDLRFKVMFNRSFRVMPSNAAGGQCAASLQAISEPTVELYDAPLVRLMSLSIKSR